MTKLKRYIVQEPWKDYTVTLEVDHDILTKARAQELNSFWSGAAYFIDEENGDAVRAVIRHAGLVLINLMLEQGAGPFTGNEKGPFGSPGPLWTEDLQNEEGWGGSETGNPFGYCGIRCIAGDVERPGFDDLDLKQADS